MGKVIVSIVLMLLVGGCAAMDKPYEAAKVRYNKVKAVVEVTGTATPGMKVLDTIAKEYDKDRTEIRGK